MREAYVTQSDLVAGLRRLGLAAGDVVLVHSSLSAFGHLIGGAQAAVGALVEVLTPSGTLVVPTHTPENTDPERFEYPPLPLHVRAAWRKHFPAFDPLRTPCGAYMGVIAELARTLPDALRSQHPSTSFSAVGRHAQAITADHPLDDGMGERSPLARVYALDGKILLVGVDHDANSSLHLAQVRAAACAREPQGAAVLDGGARRWVTYQDLDWDDSQLIQIGADLERAHPFGDTQVGSSRLRLFSQRTVVDFATAWLRSHGTSSASQDAAAEVPETLRSGALTFRRPRVEDAARLWPLTSRAEVMRSLLLAAHADPVDVEDFLCRVHHDWQRGAGFAWVATVDERPAALVMATVADPCVSLSIGLSAVAPLVEFAAALRALVGALFGALAGTVRVELRCDPQEPRQIELAEQCGLTREGRLGHVARLADGQPVDRLLFARLRE